MSDSPVRAVLLYDLAQEFSDCAAPDELAEAAFRVFATNPERRAGLQRVFTIGLSLWHHRSAFTQRLGAELMDIVEAECGAQSRRPAASRKPPSPSP